MRWQYGNSSIFPFVHYSEVFWLIMKEARNSRSHAWWCPKFRAKWIQTRGEVLNIWFPFTHFYPNYVFYVRLANHFPKFMENIIRTHNMSLEIFSMRWVTISSSSKSVMHEIYLWIRVNWLESALLSQQLHVLPRCFCQTRRVKERKTMGRYWAQEIPCERLFIYGRQIFFPSAHKNGQNGL